MSKNKQAVVAQVEKQVLANDTYTFQAHLNALKQAGLGEHALAKHINILMKETHTSLTQKKIALPEKYQAKLKTLSILSHFHGCPNYKISNLATQLGLSKPQTLQVLVNASIAKLITVRIDEEHNLIHIIKAKTREREVTEDITQYNNGQVILIRQKNQLIERHLERLQGMTEEKKKIGGLDRDRPRMF